MSILSLVNCVCVRLCVEYPGGVPKDQGERRSKSSSKIKTWTKLKTFSTSSILQSSVLLHSWQHTTSALVMRKSHGWPKTTEHSFHASWLPSLLHVKRMTEVAHTKKAALALPAHPSHHHLHYPRRLITWSGINSLGVHLWVHSWVQFQGKHSPQVLCFCHHQ